VVVKKSGFTLIELIFAIVIIAIAVLSLPVMNQVTARNSEESLVQEAIFAAATQINEATSAHWDDNSIEPTSISLYARVIDLSGACDNNPLSPRYRLLPGHINESLHRRCLDSNTTTAANANTNNNVESLDDKEITTPVSIFTENASAQGYKDDYKYTLDVSPNATFGGTQNSDIKRITATVMDSQNNVVVRLFSYSANIGEVDYYKKEY